MRIRSVTTKDNQQIPLGKFTVLVGPNNVGKSQTLRDIHTKMTAGANARTVLITGIELEKPPTFEELFIDLDVVEDRENIGHHLIGGILPNMLSGDRVRVQMPTLRQQYEQSSDLSFILGTLGRYRVAFLDASSRLSVAQSAPSYNPHTASPGNLLQGLFKVGAASEDQLRDAFRRTFGMDVRLDYSGMQTLTLRIANEFAHIPADPREAYPIMTQYNSLDTQGDGFRSFAGVILSLLLTGGRVVLLDEPEAFLHPAQARMLGRWIGEHSQSVPGQLIVATHNANFLAGILASSTDVGIFRLNRTESQTTFNLMDLETTSKFGTSPLLSSQRVLESIFYKGVVVCEGDGDRAIYESVAVRLFDKQNTLFVNAHNKQSIKEIVDLLRRSSIDSRVVVDLDILNSHDEFRDLLIALNPHGDHAQLLQARREVADAVEERPTEEILREVERETQSFVGQLRDGKHTLDGARAALSRLRNVSSRWAPVKSMGLAGLPGKVQTTAEDILQRCQQAGLYIVPVGELEGWIDLGTKQKSRWVVLGLDAIGKGECSQELKDFVQHLLRSLGEDV